MSSTVINTQVNSTSLVNAPGKVDPFNPPAPTSVGSPAAVKKWIVQASNNAGFAFGKTVEVLLPNDTHIVDVAYEPNLGAMTSGNYCAYPAMALIDQVQVLDGTEIAHQYAYSEVIKYCLAIRGADERATLLANAGGTTFASGKCKAPIPLFFSRWVAKQGQKMPYFAAHKLKNRLKLRLTLRAAADIAASGATVGSPTLDGNFVIMTADIRNGGVDGDANWNVYQSIDFETITGTVVPTATATDVKCEGLTGNVSLLSVSAALATDLSTAHDYLKSKPLTATKLQVNSDKQYYESDSALDIDYDLLSLGMSYGDNSTLGQPLFIPIGLDNNPLVFTGALNMKDVQQLRVNATHAQGSDCQVQICAIKPCHFKIENGHLKRQLF